MHFERVLVLFEEHLVGPRELRPHLYRQEGFVCAMAHSNANYLEELECTPPPLHSAQAAAREAKMIILSFCLSLRDVCVYVCVMRKYKWILSSKESSSAVVTLLNPVELLYYGNLCNLNGSH
jgi:hypothetical protein